MVTNRWFTNSATVLEASSVGAVCPVNTMLEPDEVGRHRPKISAELYLFFKFWLLFAFANVTS